MLLRLIVSIMLSALAWCAATAQDQAPPAWTPELMMKIKAVGNVQVSPDGKQVAFTVKQAVVDGNRSEYLTHIYLAPTDGSHVVPLTTGDKSCDDPQWSPDGKWIAFLSSRSGRKNLWLVEPTGGPPTQLTDVRTAVSSYRWAPDGRSIAFVAKDAPTAEEIEALRAKNDAKVVDLNPKMNRLYVIPVTTPPKLQTEPRLLTKENRSIGGGLMRLGRAPFDWSPDGSLLVYAHVKTPAANDWTTADLAVVELATGTVRSLVATPAAESQPHFSPDGKWIAYVSGDQPPSWAGKGRIHIISVSGGTPRALADTADDFGRYSELLGWSADGTAVYYVEAAGTSLRVLAMPLDGPPRVLNSGAGMSLGGVALNTNRTHFGYGWETVDRPPEVMVAAADHFRPVQVSRIHQEFIAPLLGKTELVHWQGKDGL
ncbi:MAG: DPP IV N-terminal domain-containing protein, partial [Gemmataceae bacterium]|nr:DPP IV N-terminal domain-containing protein [Gemmataceae bacterium]